MNIAYPKSKIFVLAFLTLILILGTWSYARAAGNEITVCVKQNGAMFLVGQGLRRAACSSNEQLLTLNLQGPKGDTGEQGIPGAQGPIGPQGPQGIRGVPGSAGASLPLTRTNTYKATASVEISSGALGEVLVSCADENDILLSGGYEAPFFDMDVYRNEPLPYFAIQSWVVSARNSTDFLTHIPRPGTLTASILCYQID